MCATRSGDSIDATLSSDAAPIDGRRVQLFSALSATTPKNRS